MEQFIISQPTNNNANEVISWEVRMKDNPLLSKYKIILGSLMGAGIGMIFFLLMPIPLYIKIPISIFLFISLIFNTTTNLNQIVNYKIDQTGIKISEKLLTIRGKNFIPWSELGEIFKVEYSQQFKGVILYTSLLGGKGTRFSLIKYVFLPYYENIFLPVNSDAKAAEIVNFINATRHIPADYSKFESIK